MERGPPKLTTMTSVLRPPAPVVCIEVVRATFVHLKGIDCVEQTFRAHAMFEFRIVGGAHDPDLMSKSEEFPAASPDGSFRPSALWYLNKQVDIPNAQDYSVLESKTFKVGDDLHMVKRVDGTFTEVMDLEDFPFDAQALTVELLFMCAAEGPVPVTLTVAPEAIATTEHFSHPNLWTLHDKLSLEVRQVALRGGVRVGLGLGQRLGRRMLDMQWRMRIYSANV